RTVPKLDTPCPPPSEEPLEAELVPIEEEVVADMELVSLPPMSRREQAEFAGHLSEVMKSGLPLVPGLYALAQELPDGRVRRGLKVMASQLEAGRSLEYVLESRNVPRDLRGLVRAGLRSGQSGEILSQYVNHAERIIDLRRRMAMAWGYPLFLMLMAAGIYLFFLIFLVPQFADIYEDFGTELPNITKSLVTLSRWVCEDWPTILLVGIVVWIVLWFLWKNTLSPAQRRRFLWCLPIVGKLIRAMALARFSRLLGLLLENKVPLPEALRLAGEGAADAELGEAAHYLADVVESGGTLRGNEFACKRFPATFVQLLSRIEGRGPQADEVKILAEACQSSARMFESQARVSSVRIAALCQPLVVTFLAVSIGYLVLALFLPLIKLLNDLS
ncbi:MAG: type II secretion system F family protein, partial [Planctomycetaceae bacterium]|nr:type II secretion system F family protein [Planctomycetaceae bacterium]